MPDRDPIIVFGDDYGRHPSSCQHLVHQMLPRRAVLWVNTIGTRRPKLCVRDAVRGVGKVAQWLGANGKSTRRPENLTVINPLMWPDFASTPARRFNAWSIDRAVRRAIRDWPTPPATAVTTIPLPTVLMDRLPVKRWVYYCVDDWSSWPGLDHASLDSMERATIDRFDAVAAVSHPLVRRLTRPHCKPTLLTHGVDIRTWARPTVANCHEIDHAILRRMQALPKPIALFWGLLDVKLDADAIRRLAAQWRGSIALIGPTADGAGPLTRIDGVHLLGESPHELLPHLAAAADVLIMPYLTDHPALIASQPLKLMEYLATDRPVVSLDLTPARRWDDCCDVVPIERFAETVILRAATGATDPQLAARRTRLITESWQAKAALLESLIDGGAAKRSLDAAGDAKHPLGKCA